MVKAACHCGAVRIVMDPAPSWVLDCNCSICRRYGALWAYTRDRLAERDLSARLTQGSDAIEAYIWGDRDLATWRCKACGCVTHGTLVGTPTAIRSVNARMFAQFDPASVTVHRTDNGHSGWFWTRPDAPIWPASYPPSEPSEADDWR
jgi:hypothetical protein